MPAFHLRGIEPKLMSLLKSTSKEKDVSVNILILKLIEQGLGYSSRKEKVRYHDLDSLAGTWTEKEGRAFEETARAFEQIDEGLWS